MPDPLGGWEYTWPLLAAVLGGYLLGSIPFGLVLTRLAGMGDIRQIGSGNIGATNVLRTGNKALAAATLLLDGAKGALAVLLAQMFGPDMAVLAGAGAFLGHLFPVWLKFKGGKGVATALGILLAMSPAVGALACLTWLVAAAASRRSSVGSLASIGLSPAYAWYGGDVQQAIGLSPAYAWTWGDVQQAELCLFLALVIVVRHHANILRLIKGQEPKISFHKKDDE